MLVAVGTGCALTHQQRRASIRERLRATARRRGAPIAPSLTLTSKSPLQAPNVKAIPKEKAMLPDPRDVPNPLRTPIPAVKESGPKWGQTELSDEQALQ